MSIRLGQKNERRQADCGKLLHAALGISILITLVAFAFKDYLLTWFGASETIFPYANDYLSWYLWGTAFALLSTGMCQFIICQGFAKTGMLSVIIGAAANIVLDPVFIFVLEFRRQGGRRLPP